MPTYPTSPGWPGGGGSGVSSRTSNWNDILIGASNIAGGILSDAAGRAESRRNRKWQVDFFRNRYQWQMEDMRRAGLNPILAASQSPGGVPSGGVAQQGAAGEGLAAAGGSVLDAIHRRQQIRIQQAAIDKADADARSAAAQADIDEETRDILTKKPHMSVDVSVRGKPTGVVERTGPTLLEQQLRADLEATGSSAQQSRAIAQTQTAIQRMSNAQAELFATYQRNENVTEMTKMLVNIGGMAAKQALNAAQHLITNKVPVGKPRIGF